MLSRHAFRFEMKGSATRSRIQPLALLMFAPALLTCLVSTASAQRITPPTPPTVAPPVGWVTKALAKPSDVVSGDSLVVHLGGPLTIRLIDVEAPKSEGCKSDDAIAARNALRKMLADARGQITLFIPSQQNGGKLHSSRDKSIRAYLWTDDMRERSVNVRMVVGGWAKKPKAKPINKKPAAKDPKDACCDSARRHVAVVKDGSP